MKNGEMVNPSDLFVYGSLKPGELGFRVLKPFVESYDLATLNGFDLFVRDGLAMIASGTGNRAVPGFLIHPRTGMEGEFVQFVDAYEGTSNYSRKEVPVFVNGSVVMANAYVGRKIEQSHPELIETWTTRLDPIFGESLPLLHRRICTFKYENLDSTNMPTPYWVQLNELLGNYLVLVSILEHLLTVIYGGSRNLEPAARMKKFADSFETQIIISKLLRENLIPDFRVRVSSKVEESYTTDNPNKVIEAWYQVRSNLQHRGKSSVHDAKIVLESCVGLTNFLSEFLVSEVEGLKEDWENLTEWPFEFAHIY